MDEITTLFDNITTEQEESERLVLINELRSQVDELVGSNVSLTEDLKTMEADRDRWHEKSYEMFHKLGAENTNLHASNASENVIKVSASNVGSYFTK